MTHPLTRPTFPRIPLAAALALAGVAALGTPFAATALAAINSNLSIEPAQTFILGGGQRGAFTVSGENTGPVAVEVLARDDTGDTAVATLAPGARFEQPFARGEGALLRNTSRTATAQVKVRVTGDTGNLGMRYTPNP